MKYEYSVVGYLDGHKVAACTDALGSNVIFGGHGDTEHRVSKLFKDQESAVAAAETVVKCGINSMEWEKPMNNLFKLFAQVIT